MDKTKREEPRQTCPQCGAELEATIGTGTRHDVVFEICESYTCNLDRQGRTGAFDYYLKEWERGQRSSTHKKTGGGRSPPQFTLSAEATAQTPQLPTQRLARTATREVGVCR